MFEMGSHDPFRHLFQKNQMLKKLHYFISYYVMLKYICAILFFSMH
jgi:hypothetical protein